LQSTGNPAEKGAKRGGRTMAGMPIDVDPLDAVIPA
jgi:hypothetical protein